MEPCREHNCLVVNLNGQEICPLCWIEDTYGDNKVRDIVTIDEDKADSILFEKVSPFLQLPIQSDNIYIEADDFCAPITSTEQLLRMVENLQIQDMIYYDDYPDEGLNYPFIRIVFGKSGNQRHITVDVEPQDILTLACNGQLFR
jgi:hypothetical protein